jgi:membrane associated rhomboid family serine protease
MMDWSNAPEIVQFLRYPATSAIVALNCSVWYFLFRNRLDYADVGSSYEMVVKEGQWWRTVTASFSHISLVHLGFNMISTWQLKTAETMLGAGGYMRMTFIFLIFSIAFQQGLHFALTHTRWGEQTRRTVGVGYSCVVFAWMTWLSLATQASFLDLIILRVPFSLSPFLSLVFTQLIIPRVDFVGHLSGILAGYWQGWGLNGWLTDYWLVQMGMWVLAAVVLSRRAYMQEVLPPRRVPQWCWLCCCICMYVLHVLFRVAEGFARRKLTHRDRVFLQSFAQQELSAV